MDADEGLDESDVVVPVDDLGVELAMDDGCADVDTMVVPEAEEGDIELNDGGVEVDAVDVRDADSELDGEVEEEVVVELEAEELEDNEVIDVV